MSGDLGSVSSRPFELVTFPNEQALADSVAERWVQELRASGSRPFAVALAGGRITRRFLASVASLCRKQAFPLDNVQFFWGDERCVPPTHPESNFGVAQEHLLLPLAIKAHRIHRIRGELPEAQAAAEAETEICRTVPLDKERQPILDLVFLGMGEDGHVASLFPNETDAAVESRSVYRAVVASKPPPVRITLGYAAIAAARQVWVLASGSNKEAALRESLVQEGNTPLARVIRLRQGTTILTAFDF